MRSTITKTNPANEHPTLSVVVPAFNEQGNLSKLYTELDGALSTLDMSWEIVFVDDGSTDDTWNDIKSLHNEDPRVRGIRLSRNFGHQHAFFKWGMSCL